METTDTEEVLPLTAINKEARLVAEADALHAQAASLNQAGRFDEAKETYEKYAEALGRAEQASCNEDYKTASLRLWSSVGSVVRAVPAAFDLRRRAVAAILGAAVADAAAMPVHWVYDMGKLAELLSTPTDAAFYPVPQNAFYRYQFGRSSPYGEQTEALLDSLLEMGGWSPEAYAARNFDNFAAPSHAASGGYLDGSTKGFIRNVRRGVAFPHTGCEDAQANAISRLPPLVALLAGDDRMLPCVADMIAVTQAGDLARSHGLAAARVLEACIVGRAATPAEAVEAARLQLLDPARHFPQADDAAVAESFAKVLSMHDVPHAEAVPALGRNCHLPGNLLSTLHALVAYGSYSEAVQNTIAQGGCNASRTSLIGACFAACDAQADDEQACAYVPAGWRDKFGRYRETFERAQKLAGLRSVCPNHE